MLLHVQWLVVSAEPLCKDQELLAAARTIGNVIAGHCRRQGLPGAEGVDGAAAQAPEERGFTAQQALSLFAAECPKQRQLPVTPLRKLARVLSNQQDVGLQWAGPGKLHSAPHRRLVDYLRIVLPVVWDHPDVEVKLKELRAEIRYA